jgi:hypothetical protein
MFIECVLLSASLCHAVKDPPVVALAVTQSAIVTANAVTTYEVQQIYPVGTWREQDPIARRLMGSRPQLRSMILWGEAEVVLTMYLGERMKRSHLWIRHLWWAPQLVAIVGHSDRIRLDVQAIRGGMQALRLAYTSQYQSYTSQYP